MTLQRFGKDYSITSVSISMCISLLISTGTTYGVELQSDHGAFVHVDGRSTMSEKTAPKPNESVGEITGKISLPKGSKLTSRDVANSVVWLADIEFTSEQLEELVASRPSGFMDQVDMTYTPHVVPILVGQEVEFLNSDGSVFHGVQSRSPAKKFNLGMYPSGQAKIAVFDNPGVVDIRCIVHSEMQAFVVVLSSPFFAQVAPDGSFTIQNVPAGKHTLHLWNPRIGPIEQSLSVAPNATVKVTMELEGNLRKSGR